MRFIFAYICYIKIDEIMTTITLKINEKTKKGKIFLDLAKLFYDENNEIELMKMPSSKTTDENLLTLKDKRYLKNLRKVVVDIKSGNHQNLKTWKEFSDEL